MRILLISQFYPPVIGGIERHVAALATRLAQRQHEVTVATFRQPGEPDEEMRDGVSIRRIGTLMQRIPGLYQTDRTLAPPFPDPVATRALRRIAAQVRPEVVHAHDWLHFSYLPLKRQFAAPLVLTLHDYSLLCANHRLMRDAQVCDGPAIGKCLRCTRAHYGAVKSTVTVVACQQLLPYALRHIDYFLPVSHATAAANQLARRGLPHEVAPNFVPDDIQRTADAGDARLAALPLVPFILFVGDLVRDKGVDVLLNAYTRAAIAVPLVLIGRPGDALPPHLPPNVTVLHNWPHATIMAAWQRCLFGVAPSVWLDPAPTVVLEPMACGKPVIGTRIGGMRDSITDGVTGLLVTPGDTEDLAAALYRLANDPQEIVRLGLAAQRSVTRFMAQTVVPQIEGVYQRLIMGEAPSNPHLAAFAALKESA